MISFVIQPLGNMYFFGLAWPSGRVLLTSDIYTSQTACELAVEAVIKNTQQPERFVKKTLTGRRLYFAIVNEDGDDLAMSAIYRSERERINAMDAVQKYAMTAKIKIDMKLSITLH